MKPMFCEQCHRIERDPVMLDTETCSQCGGYLVGIDDDDGQPDEMTEWRDFDADC